MLDQLSFHLLLRLEIHSHRRRASGDGFYLYKAKRFMNIYEIGALQGWPKSWVDQLLEVQPRGKVGAGFGDAMSLSVLMRILPRALQSAGLLDKFDDVWEHIPLRGPLPGKLYERENPIDPKLQPVWQ